MIQVMVQTFQEPFILIPFLGNILWTVGCIPLGLAIWRSGRLWKWSGLLFILFGVIGIPAIFDVGVLQLIASVLLGLASSQSAWRWSGGPGRRSAVNNNGGIAPRVRLSC